MTVLGIDHVVITASDLDATCGFYDRLFGISVHGEYAPEGRVLVRKILIGGALFSVHQAGNGVKLVAKAPTVGSGDICLRWGGTIGSAVALLDRNGVPIFSGPSPHKTADGKPSQSVYFLDPDGNLIELMAAD